MRQDWPRWTPTQYCIVSVKILAERRYEFSSPLIRLFAPPHNPSPMDDHSSAKEQKLTKQCFLLPLHCSFTQSSQYRNWKGNKYSILIVSELRPPVSKSSTRISKFYAPTDSELKFYKTVIENCLSIVYNLGLSWLGTCCHNHHTMFNH